MQYIDWLNDAEIEAEERGLPQEFIDEFPWFQFFEGGVTSETAVAVALDHFEKRKKLEEKGTAATPPASRT